MKKRNQANAKTHWIWIGAILLLTLIVFWPSLQHEFLNWDDETYIHENPVIQKLDAESLSVMFDSQRSLIGNYHPITELSFAINYFLGGLNPVGYIFINLFLHLLNIWLIYLVTARIFKTDPKISLITALLFAVHPMHVESVCWIAERKDVLYTFFFLLSLILI